jgi:hypothetical protein
MFLPVKSMFVTACPFLFVFAARVLVSADTMDSYLSHPPVRPLPALMQRPMEKGPGYYVDPVTGDDNHPGTIAKPWKSINYALTELSPGDTLYLRQGIYFENVTCRVVGTQKVPITIRACPGERVIIDGSITAFQTHAQEAWKKCLDGVSDEYVSVKPHRNIRDVLGCFGDSNIALQTYSSLRGLQSEENYRGPGLWYNKMTGHIHVRLAHTRGYAGHEEFAHYRGVTDPRQVALVLSPFRSVSLFVDLGTHVHFKDLVVRGGGFNTVVLQMAVNVQFENVTVFAGTYGIRARSTGPLLFHQSAVHGMKAPWAPKKDSLQRPLLTHAPIVTEGSYQWEVFYYPFNHDWQISDSTFTDCYNGLYLSVRELEFTNNKQINLPVLNR